MTNRDMTMYYFQSPAEHILGSSGQAGTLSARASHSNSDGTHQRTSTTLQAASSRITSGPWEFSVLVECMFEVL